MSHHILPSPRVLEEKFAEDSDAIFHIGDVRTIVSPA
jgi:hypothetical protein